VLEADHHRIDAYFAAFAHGLATGSIDRAAYAAGSEGLRHHIYVEEEHHLPTLREAGLLGPVLVMLSEHGHIWDLLDALETQLRNGDPVAVLTGTWQQLETILAEHNLKEERILYPAGDQILPADIAERVLTSLASQEKPKGWTCEMAGRS
jgi:iron-sulfur cluster repair protein YtfE (RIC family)